MTFSSSLAAEESSRTLMNQASPKELRAFSLLWEALIGFFVLFLLGRRVAPLEFLVGSRLIPAVFIGVSVILLLWDFLRVHSLFRGRHIVILSMFLAAAGFSTLLNTRYGWLNSTSLLVYYVIQIFLFHSHISSRPSHENRAFLMRLNGLFIAVQTIFAVIAIISFLYRLEFAYTTPALGKVIEQGYQSQYGRVWGIYYEANFLGMSSVAAIMLSAWNMGQRRHARSIALFVIVFLIHFSTLVLSGSRSALLAFYTCVLIFAFFGAHSYFKRRGNSKRVLSLAAAGMAAFIVWGAHEGMRSALPAVQQTFLENVPLTGRTWLRELLTDSYEHNGFTVKFSQRIEDVLGDEVYGSELDGVVEGTESDLEFLDNDGKLIRKDMEDNTDFSNRRLAVWQDGLKVFAKSPLFGAGMRNTVPFAAANNLSTNDFFLRGTTLTNAYLDVLAGSGLAGFSLLLSFLVLSIRDVLTALASNGTRKRLILLPSAILAGLAIFIVFLSDVLSDFSIYSLLFWLYLGFIQGVVREDKEAARIPKPAAFICDTPLQVQNALNLLCQNPAYSGQADLFLYKQFSGADKLEQALRREGCFGEIYAFQPYPNTKVWYSPLRTLIRQWLPEYFLQRHLLPTGETKAILANRVYPVLYLSFFTAFSDSIRWLWPDSRVELIEDGLGSYSLPDLETHFRSRRYLAFNKYFLASKLGYRPAAGWYTAPSLLQGDRAYAIRQLPELTAENPATELIKRVFSYEKNTILASHRFIYLSQPLAEKSALEAGGQATEAEVLALLQARLGERLLVRVHPRQDKTFYEQYSTLDTKGNPWELDAIYSLREDHVLLGAFSTAQFMPWLLSGKQTHVVFLYPLLTGTWSGAEQLIHEVRAAYRDPKRIHSIQTLAELDQVLLALLADVKQAGEHG